MAKLADSLYHQRRVADLLAGQLDRDGWADAGQGRRWKQPNISSLSRGPRQAGRRPGPDAVRASSGANRGRWRSRDGVMQEMWALFAVYQAICKIIGIAAGASGISPARISFPHALAAATDTVAAFSP
jgi:hypothetical protein